MAGKRFTEDAVRDIGGELFDILAYLHGRAPPVFHRDIKPANIIRRPDGSLALVDFGAVQKKRVVDEDGALQGKEVRKLPYVFIDPGGDLSLGERRWVIETVEEAVERRRVD